MYCWCYTVSLFVNDRDVTVSAYSWGRFLLSRAYHVCFACIQKRILGLMHKGCSCLAAYHLAHSVTSQSFLGWDKVWYYGIWFQLLGLYNWLKSKISSKSVWFLDMLITCLKGVPYKSGTEKCSWFRKTNSDKIQTKSKQARFLLERSNYWCGL